jgi:uncharacterized SAM-binding protein YcdF (DUF218 family)
MSFVLSKVLGALFMPASWCLLLLVLAEMLTRCTRYAVAGRRIRCSVIAFLCFISLFPVGEWALAPLENAYPAQFPDRVDGIILLGGDESPHLSVTRAQPSVLMSAQRYLHFAALARKYPKAKLVFTGGSGLIRPEREETEADVARAALGEIGVPVADMVFEDKSRTTYENALYTTAIVKPQPSQNWLLVTNARHIPRSMACFQAQGWTVYAAPSGYVTDGQTHLFGRINLAEHLLELSDALHEYYGLLAYYVTGRINKLWPS